mgnify:CR=1 FL=1
MDYHVRGGIGTQIMQFLAANSIAWENNEKVEKIILNWGHYPNWMYDDSKRGNHLVDVNYLQEVFQHIQLPKFESIQGQNKTNFFHTPIAELMIKHRDRLIRAFPIFFPIELGQFPFQRKNYEMINDSMILHVRGKDRPNLTQEEYSSIWKLNSKEGKYIIGDDEELIKKVAGSNSYCLGNDSANPSEDFLTLAYGENNIVFSGFTTFTFAAAFLNQNSSFKIVRGRDKFSGGINNKDWDAMDYFESEMKNLKFLDIVV